mgnify:CR=1 FL=1
MADLTLVPEVSENDISRPTNSNLSALQYTSVKLDTSEEVVAAVSGSKSIGILQDAPNGTSTEKTATVRVAGLSKLKLGGTVAMGEYLKSDAAGKGIAVTADNDEIMAMALTSGDNNDLIAVIIVHAKNTNAAA